MLNKFMPVYLSAIVLMFILQGAMAAKPQVAPPDIDALAGQVRAIKTMLSASNATETLSIPRDQAKSALYTLNDAERYVRNMQFDDAVSALSRLMDNTTVPTNSPLYIAAQKFADDVKVFTSTMETSLLAEGDKLMEEASTVLGTAKNPDEIVKILTKVEEYKTRADRYLSRRNSFSYGEISNNISYLRSIAVEWRKMLSFMQAGSQDKAVSVLQNLKSSYSQSKVLSSPAMQKRITEIEDAQSEIVKSALASLKDRILKSTTADEMDKIMEEMNDLSVKYQNVLYNMDRTLQTKLERMKQSASQWARVVAAMDKENYQEAVQYLSSMESDSYGMALFTRKELAAKKTELMKKALDTPKKDSDPLMIMVGEMVAKASTIEDLSAIKGKIQNIARSGYSQNDLQYFVQDITSLEVMSESVKNGRFGAVFQNYPYYNSYAEGAQHRWKSATDRFRVQLRNEAIAGLCDIKDFKVAKDESPEKVLQGHIDKAVEKKQWALALKYLESYRIVFAPSGAVTSWLNDEINAARSFIYAQNCEKAEQYEAAVISYMLVLNSVSKRVPMTDAIEAIKRIKKEHPEAYEKAAKAAVPPQASVPPVGYGGMRHPMPID